MKSAWMDIRDQFPKVSWSNLVWDCYIVPWHWFIFWLALTERLQTNELLCHKDMIVDFQWAVCNSAIEKYFTLNFWVWIHCKILKWPQKEMLRKILSQGRLLLGLIKQAACFKMGREAMMVFKRLFLLPPSIAFGWKQTRAPMGKLRLRLEKSIRFPSSNYLKCLFYILWESYCFESCG